MEKRLATDEMIGVRIPMRPQFTKIRCSRFREQKKKVNNQGELSEWLGRGLQNLLHWFESNIHLGGCGLTAKTGVCGTSNKSSILFNHTTYCGMRRNGYLIGLISRGSGFKSRSRNQNYN